MERHKPIPQPFFPCCIRTPKTHRCLNTVHPNPRDEFRTCWGRVEGLLVAGELWIIHKKLIVFPRSSTTTCTNYPLEVDQSQIGHVHKAIVIERTVMIGSRQDMSSRSAARERGSLGRQQREVSLQYLPQQYQSSSQIRRWSSQ
ncbi:hypothetical protein Taro_009145 [Colocasia esculenta]|uniref:Uncharacterized protein n=1 Tax=Colocasia esculenta TaxID=4460 RepID=A0A843TVL3_COLES|nr:hypothetical protein [Colocasia esculenta]